MNQEKAIRFVMLFYNVACATVIRLYWDEVEAYMRLFSGAWKDETLI